jgi:hypothetical protein
MVRELLHYCPALHNMLIKCIDPRYEEEVSGCTASVGVISRDKIWVVSISSLFDAKDFC